MEYGELIKALETQEVNGLHTSDVYEACKTHKALLQGLGATNNYSWGRMTSHDA